MNIFDLLSQRAKDSPSQTYVLDHGRPFSFHDVYEAAVRRSHAYRHAGVREGDAVVVIASRSVVTIEVLFALLKLGAQIVPIDIDEPKERIRFLLARILPRFVLSESDVGVEVPDSCLVRTISTEELAFANSPSPESDTSATGGEKTAYVFFTTGSTGHPKGIELSHRAIISGQRWLQGTVGLASSDVQLFRTTLGVTNLLRETILPVIAGCVCCVLERGKHNDIESHIDAIDRNNVTMIGTVPILVDALVTNRRGFSSLSTLRHVICTSDTLFGEQLRRFKAELPLARIINVYGLTEAPYIAYYECQAGDESRTLIPVGRDADLRAVILDESLREAGPGEIGRLFVEGAGMLSGYWKNLELTGARLFLRNNSKVFDTGDLAYRDTGGVLHLTGRSEFLVKIGGHRVDVQELEQVFRSIEYLQDVCLLPHDIGNGVKRLAAWVVTQPGALLDERSVRTALAAKIPSYMIPTLIRFVDKLPRTHNGKIDKRALSASMEQFSDVGKLVRRDSSLAEIVSGVLNVSSVSLDKTIVEMGADSISAFLISVRAHEAGFDVHPTVLLSRPIGEVIESTRFIEPRISAQETIAADGIHNLGSFGWSSDEIEQLMRVYEAQSKC